MLLLVTNLFYEDIYLNEWLAYYIRNGVRDFLLIKRDDLNISLYKKIIDKYSNIKVILKEVSNDGYIRMDVKYFMEIRKEYEIKGYWVSFIDIDEFIYSPNKTLIDKIKDFENKNKYAIFVNWRLFGDSHYKENKNNETLIKYTKRAQDKININGKSIIKIRLIKKINNFHKPSTRNNDKDYYLGNGENQYEYNIKRKKELINNYKLFAKKFLLIKPNKDILNKFENNIIENFSVFPENNDLIINHYTTRTKKEFKNQLINSRNDQKNRYKEERFDSIQTFANEIEDRDILFTLITLNKK